MKRSFFLFFLLSLFFNINHIEAGGYAVFSIPENIQKEAYAVIRESSESFKQQDMQTGAYKVMYVLTVLNEKGRQYANFFIYEDSFRELKSFSGEIMNAAGKTIKTVGKKDLTTTALSPHLATDGKQTFYECHAPAYPFTIKYEYEVKYKNGICIYPAFYPVPGVNVALEKADYTLSLPKDLSLRYKIQGGISEPEKSTINNDSVFKWSLNDFEPLPYERYVPVSEIFPAVWLSPSKFCMYKNCGDMTTWGNFGKWQQELLTGRNNLPQKTVDKINELTMGISDKREKVKRIYEYLQNTTHYVSIQLGIGGWQPMAAEDVARTGFGDCKALSNYMKAMLEIVDIPSYFVLIRMDKNKKDFLKDYPSFGQANHAILMVPLEKDSVWLECTSQILPFGYIHSSIAGHDAMAIGKDNAFFCTLPSYPIPANQELNSIDIRLEENGTAGLTVRSTRKLESYENTLFKLRGLNTKEEYDFLAGQLQQVHKPNITNLKKEEVRSDYPEMNLAYAVNCEDYASKTGSRMFIPLNPVRTLMKGFLSGSARRFDILLPSGIFQSDTISIQIPEGYVLEQMPKTGDISSEYGSFKNTIIQKDNTLKYIQTLKIIPGRYAASQFEDMKNFFSQIDSFQDGKIGLKKE